VTDQTKKPEPDRLKYLDVLRLAAYQSFNDRRGYEWKLSLAIWTPLAVLVAGLVQPGKEGNVFPIHGQWYGVLACMAGIAIVGLHIYFNNGVAKANNIDRTKVRMYEDQIHSSLTFNKTDKYREEKDTLARQIKMRSKPPDSPSWQWWQWGHRAQVGITLLLTIAVVAIFWVRVTL